MISQNPDIVRWAVEMEQRCAVMKWESANKIPDLNVSLGVRRLNEIDRWGIFAGLTIPLPLFSRNQGGILEASRRISKAEDESRSANVRVLTSISE